MISRATRVVVLAAPVLLSMACSTNQAAAPPATPPPPTVPVVTVQPERIEVPTEWITTLDGQVNAQIRPQVSGYLVRRLYEEGSRVRKGQVLFVIDARPFTVAVAQAEARVAEANAQLGRAQRDVERDTPLARERAIAQSQLDNDLQTLQAAQAGVKAAEASVDAAKLNVSFTQVRSLVDGIAAIATAQIGDLVTPQTLLTTVSQVDPIRAYFSISEREYLQFADAINGVGSARRAWTGKDGLRLTLADGTEYARTGRFQTADREIDPKTGTMRVSALFPNPQHVLRPGQYGRVTAMTRTLDQALLVPQRAVTETQAGPQVRVVSADGKVQVRDVKPGARIAGRWIIEGGLQAGDRVVVDGGAVPEGTAVNVKPFVEAAQAARSGNAPAAPTGSSPATPASQPAAGAR
ncbi:MAG TPA: efflux RND transporter periplasmic adaptor subunit [Luteitalea sp.]|nr:efflux RND transporter periplasmic adaptor subunit [Luteitalea sp.]